MMSKHSNPAMMGGLTVSLSEAILALVSGAMETIWTWQSREDTRASMAKLDDHLMADMGLTKDQVEAEISKPFWRA